MKTLDCVIEFDTKSIQKSADGALIIEGYANTVDKDRVSDVVLPEAFAETLPGYMENPVLLFQHNWDIVIGKILSASIDEKGLKIKAYISQAADCDDIRTKVKERILRTFSIGYNELDADFNEATKTNVIKKLELLEISIVTIPANTMATFVPIEQPIEDDVQTTSGKQAVQKNSTSVDQIKVERREGESDSDCVSRAIPILMKEGYPQDQAIAIAYSQCGAKESAKSVDDCGCGSIEIAEVINALKGNSAVLAEVLITLGNKMKEKTMSAPNTKKDPAVNTAGTSGTKELEGSAPAGTEGAAAAMDMEKVGAMLMALEQKISAIHEMIAQLMDMSKAGKGQPTETTPEGEKPIEEMSEEEVMKELEKTTEELSKLQGE